MPKIEIFYEGEIFHDVPRGTREGEIAPWVRRQSGLGTRLSLGFMMYGTPLLWNAVAAKSVVLDYYS